MSLTRRSAILSGVLLFGFSFSAFGNVGFCPQGASVDCFTGTGLAGETIGISATLFQMEAHSAAANATWDLLLAIPDGTLSTPPTLTFAGSPFTLNLVTNDGHFTTGSLYAFAGLADVTPKSMSFTNMAGSQEQAVLGFAPTFFEVFDYNYQPGFAKDTRYNISVGGSGLPPGTFVAADGGSSNSATPFTTVGLVGGVPEPSQIGFLTGVFALFGIAIASREWKKRQA